MKINIEKIIGGIIAIVGLIFLVGIVIVGGTLGTFSIGVAILGVGLSVFLFAPKTN